MNTSFAYRFTLAPALETYRPEIEHALSFLDRAYGLKRDAAAARLLHYGPEPPAGGLAVPAVLFPKGVRLAGDGIHPDHAALEALATGRGPARLFPARGLVTSNGWLGYDAIGLIALMLTRLEERGSAAADRYGRFLHTASLGARFHKFVDPPADIAARDLAAALTGHAEPPNATNYEVLLTHDVDRLRGYHRPFNPLRAAAGDVLKRGAPRTAVAGLAKAYLGGDPWHSARRLMARSEAAGLRSRFYFMGPSAAPMDSPYALSMVPLLRCLTDEIHARGHVVGFHPGFGTATDRSLWLGQKRGLEQIVGAPVSEGRQHVLGYDAAVTPDIWAANGMKLDLTLAFPETTGFRAGTCRRFLAYSLVQRRSLELEQASTTVMDFGLFGGKYRDLDLDQALDEAMRTAEICRRYGGTLVLLQHLGRCDKGIDSFFDAFIAGVANQDRPPSSLRPGRLVAGDARRLPPALPSAQDDGVVARELARPRSQTGAAPVFKVGLAETLGWRMRHAGPWRLWLKGSLAGDGDRGVIASLNALPPTVDFTAASRFASALQGRFALVAESAETLVAAVDQLRSIPLVYGRRGETLFLDQDGQRLQRALGLGPADTDPDAALSVALAGYTIGNGTLFRDVRQLGPGQFLLARADGRIDLGCHQRYKPYQPLAGSRVELKRSLKEVIGTSLHRLIAVADGRPIAIPLSAGCDSRLVASGLKAFGYRNVLTFAYGLPGNHEAETSRTIARQLGFKWRFVPFSSRLMRAAYESADYAAFRSSCDSLTGIHFPQDYLALVTLQREGFLPPETLIVNGQSGDFITGNHVPDALATPRHDLDEIAREKRVIDALIARHFKQWAILATPGNLARIRAMLRREIASIGGMPADAAGDHGIFEWCEFQDRQSKYVLNGQRLYEYLGFDWNLPLWDDAWLEFWSRVPVEAKQRQNLYREVLLEVDFSAVWRGIPINAKTVRPRWMGPVRAGLKALHVAAGQRRWHAFERRYLQYWMDNLCSYAPQSYWPVATDHRRPHTGIAYHIETYLSGKGLGLDGLPLEERIG